MNILAPPLGAGWSDGILDAVSAMTQFFARPGTSSAPISTRPPPSTGKEVTWWEDFDVDDREDAVVDVVGVDFTGYYFFALVVDFLDDLLLDDGWMKGG